MLALEVLRRGRLFGLAVALQLVGRLGPGEVVRTLCVGMESPEEVAVAPPIKQEYLGKEYSPTGLQNVLLATGVGTFLEHFKPVLSATHGGRCMLQCRNCSKLLKPSNPRSSVVSHIPGCLKSNPPAKSTSGAHTGPSKQAASRDGHGSSKPAPSTRTNADSDSDCGVHGCG